MKSLGKYSGLFFLFILFLITARPSKGLAREPIPKPLDSLRTEIANGQKVIVYSVNAHETLYSIARRYKINPKTLISFNHNISTLILGQEILIPLGPAGAIAPGPYNGNLNSTVVLVHKGETMYSIAHAHGLNADDIMKANQLPDPSLKLGQKLIIPSQNSGIKYNNPKPEPSTPPKELTKNLEKSNSSLLPIPPSGLYTVGSGETIYSIGFKYGVKVEEIRSLNNVVNNDIKVGQVIRLKSNVPLPDNKALSNQVINKSGSPIENPIPREKTNTPLPADISKPETTSNNRNFIPSSEPHRTRNIPREFKEEGMGIWIDNTDLNQARSVALHRLAPVGTVIKVTNPMTKKSIFVKVVGSFPATEETKNAVLVISKSAALLIGAIDPHFRVELSYAY